MSLPRQFIFNQELSKLGDVLATSAPPTTNVLCSAIDMPSDTIAQMSLSLSPEHAGSLLSVQSAPPEQRDRSDLELPLATVGAYLAAMSPTTEQEEDSLLTLSSVTGRPLLANRLIRSRSRTDGAEPCLDSGYSWVVVFGAFLVQFWVGGLFKSYGVLYVEIMESFPDSSESMASWIPAALSTLCLALAPLSSALCEKYSCRLVVFFGGLFCAAGLMTSYFSTQLFHLLLSFGVMTGIGGGLSTTPGIVIVSQYFDKHRALANGICVSGTAAGSFVFPTLIEKLVSMYGLHGTLLLLGGGMLHVCVAACLYRTPPVRARSTPDSGSVENNALIQNKPEPPACKTNRLQTLFQTDDELTLNKKNILLSEETKKINHITEILHPGLIEVACQKPLSDSEDSECLDVLGVVGVHKDVARLRLRPTRSSSILHSVEDLSTDSTCVYKASHRQFSRSLYIKPPVSRLPAQLSEPIVLKQKEVQIQTKEEVDQRGCVEKISRYLDVTLLKSWRFGLLCASVALMSCGSPYALYYLPAYTVSAGHSKAAAGRLVAISAVLDLCGRLGLGWLCDLQIFCRKKAYILSIMVAGSAVLSLPSLSSWWALAVASAAYGLCLGCWFLLVPVLLADTFGTDRIASSYGLVRMFQSSAAISVPPIAVAYGLCLGCWFLLVPVLLADTFGTDRTASSYGLVRMFQSFAAISGYLRDVTGGYASCFYCMGTAMALGSIPVIVFYFTTKNDGDDAESSDD